MDGRRLNIGDRRFDAHIRRQPAQGQPARLPGAHLAGRRMGQSRILAPEAPTGGGSTSFQERGPPEHIGTILLRSSPQARLGRPYWPSSRPAASQLPAQCRPGSFCGVSRASFHMVCQGDQPRGGTPGPLKRATQPRQVQHSPPVPSFERRSSGPRSRAGAQASERMRSITSLDPRPGL